MGRAAVLSWIRVLLFGAAIGLFFACGGATETTPIVQTVVVEKAVEKQVVQTVVQTVVVEKAVEKQVVQTVVQTVVVEKVVVATAAPSPTATALPPLKRATLVRVARDGQLGANPNTTVDPFTRQSSIASCCYERLTNLASDFSPTNVLAAGWSSNPTATEWTFNLRKGVKFHSGKEFTAQDVIYSFKEMFKAENGYPGRNQLGTFIDATKIEAVDSHTVKFTLPSPQAELPGLISIVEMVIVPEGQTVKERQTTVNGTGPFVMEKFDVNGQVWQWKKNTNYWDAANRPRTDLIEISGIPDDTNRVAAISTGAVDLITATGGAVKVALVRNLEKNPDVQLLVGDPAISIVFFMWMDTPPFDDIRVRTAMKKIIDREFIAKTVLGGYALPGNDAPIPVTWAAAYQTQAPKADVEGAKKLLQEAGYTKEKPLKLTMHVGDIHAGALEMTQAFQEMAFKAGVEIQLTTYPKDRYWDVAWLKQPFGISAWGIRAPAQALSIAYTCNAAWPESHWCRKDYDDLLKQAAATVDLAKRLDLYKQAQKMLVEEGGLINVLFTKPVDAIRKNCGGFTPPIPFYQTDYSTLECKTR